MNLQYLLPKLISCKMRVSGAEKFVEVAKV